ncbi:IQ motif-containing protein H isoform X2 [Megachile rotundata]
MNIEQACEECLLRLKIDLLTATRDRMQPPSYLSTKEIDRSYEICCDALNQAKDELSCCYTLENISKANQHDTEPRGSIRTLFDESDLKFRHEMIYLRTKMFSLPRKRVDFESGNEITAESVDEKHVRTSVKLSLQPKAFMEVLHQKEPPHLFSIDYELSKLPNLKCIDGYFRHCDIWSRILDVHGNQYGSRWHLVLRPQIERIVRKRAIPVLHLKPRATFNFLSTIEENGANFLLEKRDLIRLVGNKKEIRCLTTWRAQFCTIEGQHIAATMIQALWRGYLLRKRKRESNRLYIAASYIWFSWLALKQRRDLHQRYLQRMLISLQTTRELSLKLSKEFNNIVKYPHVMIHLPSIGHPYDVRQTFDPKTFRLMQNVSSMRICMVRNPNTEIIYVLPLKPTEDLLMMYSDLIESINPADSKRITFIALSQIDTFKNRSMNLSRILHCSEDSLQEIRKKIAGKAAFFLPWFVDECDMRLAGSLNIPLLSPDMELQRTMLNASTMTSIIENLGLLQPIHARNIKDYKTLCTTLANFIVLHTEVCVWLIKLNYGILNRHFGIFLINHISVPFMPLLRREREKHGQAWKQYPSLREAFLEQLMQHLPRVVSSVTRLSKLYASWKEFFVHIQKYGCLLQAIPMEKNSKTISVSLFLAGKWSGMQPKWIGTADKLNLESEVISTFLYMIPQSSLDMNELKSTVNKFAMGIQNDGYVGYLTVDCYCYTDQYDEKLTVLLQNVRPFYSFVESYIDWLKFVIGGTYIAEKNQFLADVPVIPDSQRKNSAIFVSHRTPKWNETQERCAIIIGQMYHTRFSVYRWPQLKDLFERCGITFDSKKKLGSSIILHDNEIRHFGLMIAASPSMVDTLTMACTNLIKLNEALTLKSKGKFETNLPTLIDFFERQILDYKNLAVDECLPNM